MVVGPKEALRNLLVIEGGRLMGPLAGLDQRSFELERNVVQNELTDCDERGEPSSAQGPIFEALYPDGHRYHRPVAGTAASLSRLTLADAQTFAEQHYVPSNVTLYVAGDVSLSNIHELFGRTIPEHFAVAPASGPVKPPIRLSKDVPPVAALPVARPPVTLQAPVAGPMVYLAWSLPRAYGANGALLRAIRSALAADRIWMSANSAIKSIRTTLVAGREGSTLVCAAALKQGRDPEKILEKILDQIHRFSETDATSGPKDGEEDVGFQDSAAGYFKPDSARTMGTAGLCATVDVQIPRYKMTAVVDYAMEMESVLQRAVDRPSLPTTQATPRRGHGHARHLRDRPRELASLHL